MNRCAINNLFLSFCQFPSAKISVSFLWHGFRKCSGACLKAESEINNV